MNYQGLHQQQINYEEEQRKPYGNMKIFCSNQANASCMLGPHYYVFLPTLAVLATLIILMYTSSYPLLTTLWKFVIGASIALCIISYLLVGFSNPGIQVKLGQINPQMLEKARKNRWFCERCNVIKINGTRHCTDCDVCIIGHDHHCPWIGKCVGNENKGRFYWFLLMIFGTVILFFISVVNSKV